MTDVVTPAPNRATAREEDLDAVSLAPVAPNADAGIDAHASDPGGLLALALLLFDGAPDSWIVLPVALAMAAATRSRDGERTPKRGCVFG